LQPKNSNHKRTHFILLLSIQLIKRLFVALLYSLFLQKCPKSFEWCNILNATRALVTNCPPPLAAHSVAASRERQRTGRLDSVSIVVFMLADRPHCASRLVHCTVHYKQGICWPAGRR